MKQVGATDLHISTRQRLLMMLISQIKNEDKKVTNTELAKRLGERTGYKISLQTLARDLQEINTENTFVKDIASTYYSRMNQQSIEEYLFVKSKALNLAEKEDKPTIKLMSWRLAMDAEKLIQETLNGRACDISVAMMGSAHKQLKTEYEIMKAKVEKIANQ